MDNDADPDEGAITLQEKTWLLSRWLSERNRLRKMGSDCAFKCVNPITTETFLKLDLELVLTQVSIDWPNQSVVWCSCSGHRQLA